MENVIIFIISTIVQSIAFTYFVTSMTKLLTKKDYPKRQIIVSCILIAFSVAISQIIKKYISIINIFLIIFLLTLILRFIMKINLYKSLFLSIVISVFSAITELITMFIGINIFSNNAATLAESNLKLLILLIIQNILIILSTKLLLVICNKKQNLTENIINITHKEILLFVVLIITYTFPQMIILVFTDYSYPSIFLIINTIQFILIFIFLTIYLKKSIEHEKVQMDLYTSELHNKTLIGMVDGVRTLKHDYNNIMQSLNGYITTKQYDKLAEHINGVLGECNIVNNLSVIDPKIFNEPAIYGIVGSKYFLANKENITFDFDIMTNIAKIDFSKPNLSRILGILLDNAIEATKKANKSYIRLEIKYDKRKNADVIRIFNTYDTNIQIDLNKIYEKGFSTKEVKSGIGLWEVKKLIDKSKNSQIYATINNDMFVQNIIIEKTEQ